MSKDFLKWTIEIIREDESLMHWVEERKFEWVPIVKSAINSLFQGSSIIIVTDREREWFAEYILGSINSRYRPLLPFYKLDNLYPHLDLLKESKDIDLIYDMLSISFESRFIIWYIGKSDSNRSEIAKRRDDSLLWIFDDKKLQKNFYLSSKDTILDLKLLQLYRLFDKSISAALFSEVDILN